MPVRNTPIAMLSPAALVGAASADRLPSPVSVPANCPPGDTRGATYKATSTRTKGSWPLPDSVHSCGGA